MTKSRGQGRVLRAIGSSDGATLVESALVLPILLFFVINVGNFSAFIYAWVTLGNAARSAVLYEIYNGVAVGAPGTPPTYSQLQSVVAADVASLPNYSTVTIEVCSNTNGAVSCAGTGSYSPPLDPEPATYTSYSVDLVYSYTPMFTSFSYPFLNLYLTIPPTTIHQQAVMRSMQ